MNSNTLRYLVGMLFIGFGLLILVDLFWPGILILLGLLVIIFSTTSGRGLFVGRKSRRSGMDAETGDEKENGGYNS